MSVYRRLITYCMNLLRGLILHGGVRRLSARLWRASYSRNGIVSWGVITAGLLTVVMVGRADNASFDNGLLARAEMIHRQRVAVADLNEKALMVGIIDQLDDRLSNIDRARIAPIIVEEARQYGFDPLFLVAVIITESSFGPTEVSHMGARGLMQIKPSVARAVAKRRGLHWSDADALFDPAYNVRLGTHYLFELVGRFRSVKRAIIAYNYGETALSWRIETGQRLPMAYFKRVKNHYHALRERFDGQVPWEPVQFDRPL